MNKSKQSYFISAFIEYTIKSKTFSFAFSFKIITFQKSNLNCNVILDSLNRREKPDLHIKKLKFRLAMYFSTSTCNCFPCTFLILVPFQINIIYPRFKNTPKSIDRHIIFHSVRSHFFKITGHRNDMKQMYIKFLRHLLA